MGALWHLYLTLSHCDVSMAHTPLMGVPLSQANRGKEELHAHSLGIRTQKVL